MNERDHEDPDNVGQCSRSTCPGRVMLRCWTEYGPSMNRDYARVRTWLRCNRCGIGMGPETYNEDMASREEKECA